MIFISYRDFRRIAKECGCGEEERRKLTRILFQTVSIINQNGTVNKYVFPRKADLSVSKIVTIPDIIGDNEKSVSEKAEVIKREGNVSIISMGANVTDIGTLRIEAGGRHYFEKDEQGNIMSPHVGELTGMDDYRKMAVNISSLYAYLSDVLSKGYSCVSVANPMESAFTRFRDEIMPYVTKKTEKVKTDPVSEICAIIAEKGLKNSKTSCAILRRAYDMKTIDGKKLAECLKLDKSNEGLWYGAVAKGKQGRALLSVITEFSKDLLNDRNKTFIDKAASICCALGIEKIEDYYPEYVADTEITRKIDTALKESAAEIDDKIKDLMNREKIIEKFKPLTIKEAVTESAKKKATA